MNIRLFFFGKKIPKKEIKIKSNQHQKSNVCALSLTRNHLAILKGQFKNLDSI